MPPAALLEDCKIRDVAIKVNSDLWKALESAYGDIHICNADKAALRDWAGTIQGK